MQMQSFRSIRSSGFRVRQRGQGMTEYIIITALIAIAAIAAVTYFGSTAREQVDAMSNELAGKSGQDHIQRAAHYANQADTDAAQEKELDSYNNATAN